MSEFEEALARSVQDGIARGGLPGAADAVRRGRRGRRGRRRSLRARGGVMMLGVAVVAGDGVLPAAQWPGYDVAHWKVSPSCGLADRSKCRPGDATDGVEQVKVGDLTGHCGPTTSFPLLSWTETRSCSPCPAGRRPPPS